MTWRGFCRTCPCSSEEPRSRAHTRRNIYGSPPRKPAARLCCNAILRHWQRSCTALFALMSLFDAGYSSMRTYLTIAIMASVRFVRGDDQGHAALCSCPRRRGGSSFAFGWPKTTPRRNSERASIGWRELCPDLSVCPRHNSLKEFQHGSLRKRVLCARGLSSG
jgi:hypothetical protein